MKYTYRGEFFMKKIAWITDTAAQLDDDFIRKHDVHILPLGVVFSNESYRESVNLTQEEFYNKLHLSKVSPKTSQPAIGEMLLYMKNCSQKDTILRLLCMYQVDFRVHLKAHRRLLK